MGNVLDFNPGKPYITAEQFLIRIDEGNTDFSELNQTQVRGEVNLGRRVINTEVKLGKLVFLDTFNFCSANILAPFKAEAAVFRGGIYALDSAFADSASFEKVHCYGPFTLGHSLYKKGLCLGESIFLDLFFADKAEIEGVLYFENAVFRSYVKCHNLVVDTFDLGTANFLSVFDCGKMVVKYCLDFGSAKFVNPVSGSASRFDCSQVVIQKDVRLNEPVFQSVNAGANSALAWVLREYIAHKVRWNISHAPLHLR